MKILGISFGTKNGRNDSMCKEALMGAAAAGAEIEFIRAMDLDIHHCTGCNSCVMGQIMGHGVKCVQKDEFEWMLDKMLEADGIFFSVPIFEKGAPGLFHTMMDRFGPRTDRGNVMDSIKMAEEKGTVMPDKRLIREKAVSYIGIGGSDWSTRVECDFGIHAMSPMWTIIDQDIFQWSATIIVDEERKARIRQMGYDLAIAAGDLNNLSYKGDTGVCPVCHCREFYLDKTGKAICCLCGVEGSLEKTKDGYTFTYPEEELVKAHTTLSGKAIHMEHINSGLGAAAAKMRTPEFKEVKKTYVDFIKPTMPER